jgi:hypothetical protein
MVTNYVGSEYLESLPVLQGLVASQAHPILGGSHIVHGHEKRFK